MEKKQETLVFYASPGTSHLDPMVEFAKLIVTNHPSFSVTILLTCFPGMPESAFDHVIASSASTPSIAFLRLPTKSPSSKSSFVELSYEIPRLSCHEVCRVLERISGEWRIKAFVIDFFCNAAFEVSMSLGIATYFFTISGAGSMAGLPYRPEVLRGNGGGSGDPGKVINVPGLPHSFSMYKKHSGGEVAKLFVSTAINMLNSSGIIVRAFPELEDRTIITISEGMCTPYGPARRVYCSGENDGTPGKELTWLDSQPSKTS